MIFKTIFLCLFIAFVCGRELSGRKSNNSKVLKPFYIHNGEVAKPDEARFVVTLLHKREDLLFTHELHFCGGSLIDRETVLTAAHCVYRDNEVFVIRYGTNDLKEPNFPDIEVKKIISHPNYIPERKWSQMDDIAILKLAQPVEHSYDHVRFIELPQRYDYDLYYDDGDDGGRYDPGTEVTTYGRGQMEDDKDFPTKMMKTTLKIVDPKESGHSEKWQKTHVYAKSENSSNCKGDSGGPLVFDNVLIGIFTSKRGEICEPNIQNTFIKVHAYLDWIQKNR